MNKSAFLPLIFASLSLFLLPGCVGLVGGAAATTGVAAAQEGGLSRATRDFAIQAEINDLWFKYDIEIFRKLDLTVKQGRVLITGVVQNPEHRVEAVRLAWQPKGVEQVINEIQVANSRAFTSFARDTWISTRLRTALTFDRAVQSINYSIDTVQGTVYLMGIAQSQMELNRVVEVARTIKDVKQVVSYVKFAGKDNALNEQTFDANANDGFGGNDNIQWEDTPPNDFNTQPIEQDGPTMLTPPPSGPVVQQPVYQDPSSQVIESEDLLWNGG